MTRPIFTVAGHWKFIYYRHMYLYSVQDDSTMTIWLFIIYTFE